MNEAVITDLKQFIATTVSQQLVGLEQRLEEKINQQTDNIKQLLDSRIDEVLDVVGDALEGTNDATHEQLTDHERRITRLESRKASA